MHFVHIFDGAGGSEVEGKNSNNVLLLVLGRGIQTLLTWDTMKQKIVVCEVERKICTETRLMHGGSSGMALGHW